MNYSPYSFTKIKTYFECPKSFYYKYIEKLKVKVDPRFFEKGRFYHSVLEYYPEKINFKFKFADEKTQDIYKENIKKFIKHPHVQNLLENKFVTELEFKFDEEMNLTNKTKWKSHLYGYIDFIGKDEVIYIVDWKSKNHGEKYPTDKEQLEMYAGWVFKARPNLQKIKCEFAYIENITFDTFEYTREDGEKFIENINNKINTIQEDSEFKKNVSSKCNSCDYFNNCKPFNINIKRN